MTPILEVKDLRVWRGGKQVLAVPHLTVTEGETLAVIGPNGAGKSTLMLAIAQLLKSIQGEIYFRGNLLSPKDGFGFRRRIALVLQDPLLLDASVFDNIAIGLRFRRISKAEIVLRVDEWLDRLGITHLRERVSRQLSGGEAQRVSLARAFAINPDILLLDEPFGALDAPTRVELLQDFQSLLDESGKTAIFVTHDQNEALLMGDRVAVIWGGRLRQIGTPEQIFNTPVDSVVAEFVGVETVIPGKVVGQEDGCVQVNAGGVQLEAVGTVQVGREVFFCLRPEDITLWSFEALPPSSARNRIAGFITQITPQGPLVKVAVDCCDSEAETGFSLVVLVTRPSAQEMGLVEGMPVQVTFKASAVHLIPR